MPVVVYFDCCNSFTCEHHRMGWDVHASHVRWHVCLRHHRPTWPKTSHYLGSWFLFVGIWWDFLAHCEALIWRQKKCRHVCVSPVRFKPMISAYEWQKTIRATRLHDRCDHHVRRHLTNSMEQVPSWKVNSNSANQGIFHSLWSWIFIAMFTRAHHLPCVQSQVNAALTIASY
jgi:hypothetical protein